MVGDIITDTSAPASCGKLKGRGVKGTFCRPTCQAGELEVCWDTSECTGATCTPFATFAIQLGYCK
jgi:hypothetical protein